jgi:hypothetical protein
METPFNPILGNQLTDINGLRFCGIFPKGKEPSIRTLREWTRRRCIPHHKVGHFVYFDPVEVSVYIRTRLRVPPRTEAAGVGDARRSALK